ncbi:MAG: AmmeMemoRadiSam system radical SAM enzyme [archaeon]
MKLALYWKQAKENIVQCQLCPHFCTLKDMEKGKCKVRQNIKGKLFSLTYNKPCSISIDPIEKKPLYHFLPGKKTLSIATVGCNLSCSHCQNYEISQSEEITGKEIKPEAVIKTAIKENSKIISYTYTEPTIFYEYMLDIARLARKNKMKNTTITNGFINQEPLKKLCNYLDGSNIDLKSISDDFYKKICGARLNPILEAIKTMHKAGVWIELTCLLIPGENDTEEEIKKLILWIKKNLGENVPLHFSAFYPVYKILDKLPTSIQILIKARKLALKAGLHYVYTGNLRDEEGSTTFCPKCRKAVIKRDSFTIIENKIINGKCPCGEKIPGVWE